MLNEIGRAFFHAPATREVYVELHAEERERGQDLVGRLRVSLYGTRDASANWQREVSKHLEALGFERGQGFPGGHHGGDDGARRRRCVGR